MRSNRDLGLGTLPVSDSMVVLWMTAVTCAIAVKENVELARIFSERATTRGCSYKNKVMAIFYWENS